MIILQVKSKGRLKFRGAVIRLQCEMQQKKQLLLINSEDVNTFSIIHEK